MDAAAAMSSATNRKLLSFKKTDLHACFIEMHCWLFFKNTNLRILQLIQQKCFCR